MSTIPAIDFNPFMAEEGAVIHEPPTKAQIETAAQIDTAFREHGFLVLNYIGIDEEELQDYYQQSAMLFALDDTEKKLLKPIDRKTNAGYAGSGVEALNSNRSPDLKEIYNIPNPHLVDIDSRATPEGFAETYQTYWKRMRTAAHNFCVACAVALDLPTNYFLSALKQFDLAVVRLNYYPPCDYTPGKSTGEDVSSSLRVGEHTDFGMFTFLFCDSPGLQVKAVEGGEIGGVAGGESGGWMDVPVLTGTSVIVNTGALMARWTNDLWKATAHRVVVGSELEAMSHRFSIAAFMDPDKGAIIEVDPRFVEDGDRAKYEPISGWEYLMGKLTEIRPSVQ